MCLKKKYEKEGKIKCINDNKAFNLRPEQYAKNHYILKLLQSKKTVITNININKNFNLINNNNVSLNKTNAISHRSEHVNTISFLKNETNRINSANIVSSNTIIDNNESINLRKGSNLNMNFKLQSILLKKFL